MVKYTKAQLKNLDRVEAWLNGTPFKENSKAKPAVPELTTEDVLAQYLPNNPQGCGAYYTPFEMAQYVIQRADYAFNSADKVLEPCAGIGNLVYAMLRAGIAPENVDAWELDVDAAKVGLRLLPEVNWTRDTILESTPQPIYDLVFANPPYNTTWAIGGARSEAGVTKSEHLFLEYAIRSLKPGGYAVFIAPYNLLTKLPKKAQAWFDERMTLIEQFGPLPGEFELTKIQVYAFVVQRTADGVAPAQPPQTRPPCSPTQPAIFPC